MAKLQKSIEKKNNLVQATIELVNNNGFHATPISKIAKMANVSPATIYLYFESKQDLVNKVYLEVKEAFTAYAFATYTEDMSVVEGFEIIWKRIANFKLKECKQALFLAQCDNTPIIDEASREEGIKHLQPLLDLWERGQDKGIIKPVSNYLLYAYTISPLAFLMLTQQRGQFKIEEKHIEQAYQAAWDSIKL
ncbi:TetR/AcrR family transcriptional regulator [Marixanthomonas ophiurae]|uniref:TetR/AcrR family transcriptional regulator n=1 Tax=Marixanthomonas ophiurae TaxID=387659 RepID=A0A3E1Q7T3_9FLAO|nr:TetR/AcrR family transcriptional regulator [Marixanthomonas ophiurae]RFN58191.1 TetR/AcrR family transcriptional regulator [Marixanthomonas ophiurae]